MQKNNRKAALLLTFIFLLAAGFFTTNAFAQFVGPGSTPPAGSGVLQVDTNYNVGLATSSAAITPTTGLPANGFGRLFTVSSNTNPGFSLFNGTNRYTWYADTASGTLSLWTGTKVQQITPGGSVYGYDYHSINNSSYYVDPGLSIMPYSAIFAGNVGIGTTAPVLEEEVMGHYAMPDTSSTPTHGILRLSQNAGTQVMDLGTGSGGGWIQSYLSSDATQVRALLLNPNGGNVGIGTTNPSYALTVKSPGNSVWALGVENSANTNLLAGVYQTASGHGVLSVFNSSGSQNVKLTTDGTNSWINSGNVGIGTASPTQAKFVISGPSAGASQWWTDGTNSGELGFWSNTLQVGTANGIPLQFLTGGSVRETIDASGNVGIGTTAPISRLDVRDSASKTDTGNDVVAFFGSNDASGPLGVTISHSYQNSRSVARIVGTFYGTSGAPLDINRDYNGSGGLTVLYNGNVGVGTTTPTTAGLVVSTNVGGVGLDMAGNRIQNLGAPVNPNDAATKSYVDSAYVPGGSAGNVGGTGTTGYIPRWTATSTIGNSAVYQSGSNIGIGTTGPSTLLQVGNGGTTGKISVNSQDNGYGQFQIGNPSSGGEASMSFISGVTGFGGAPTSANGTSYVWDIGAGNYGIGGNKFGIGNQSYGGPILVVQANGNVGIGTTSPGTNLDVNGNIQAQVLYDRNNTNYYVEPSAAILPYSAIFAGSVGIGNTAPVYSLDVSGSLRATGNWSLGGAAQTNLNMNNYNIGGVNKLSVTSIDPLYNIDGVNYSTYAPSISGGVKEEYVGNAKLRIASGKYYQYALNFDSAATGTDLWVWRQAVDFSSSTVEVFATPIGTPVPIAYQIEGNSIVFTGTAPVEFSYRLVGARFDWKNWPTLSPNQTEKANLVIK